MPKHTGHDAENVSFFIDSVLDFYQKHRREFTWRNSSVSPYAIWVSEVMLQQTQASRVVAYYDRFLKRFPDVSSLASVSWEEFLPYWDGLGYYRRGRNMLAAARTVMSEFDGVFPCEVNELEKLPGVGAYTARAVASFACGAEVLAWDTNFDRVFGRYFRGGKTENGKQRMENSGREVQEVIRTRKYSFADFNAAVMDFGSLVCAKNPKCEVCPLQTRCRYFREDGKRERVKAESAPAFPLREARAFVVLHENHKKYFSSENERFAPFVLPPPRTSREDIKAFFADRYGLNVAVRPPRARVFVDEVPTLLIFAQILSGKHRFRVFSYEEAKKFLDELG